MSASPTRARVAGYERRLRSDDDWDAFLAAESGLPGPRGNLELMAVVAVVGDEARFRRYADLSPAAALTNTPGEFLACCGVLGYGRLVAAGGRDDLLAELRTLGSDPRWRVREAVAMALQRVGDADIDRLLGVVSDWSAGTALEQRAAVAAICEPRLLRDASVARSALGVLERITREIPARVDRRDPGFVALRKALGYGWSVAAVAAPETGLPALERLAASSDRDVRWILRENLRKDRLRRLDPAWVTAMVARLGG